MNFPLAVVHEVKKSVKTYAKNPFIVGYRLSPEEIENPGIKMEDTLQFVDKLVDQHLDYLHISVRGFWNGSIRDTNDKKSRIIMVYEHVGKKLPIIGVGLLRTPDEVMKALNTGVPLVALTRELIMEPQWIQKLETGQEETIRITLSKNDQKELMIPDQLWQAIMTTPGWFPLV